MGKYFIGKGVQLLTEETENKIRIYKLGLLQPEFGHMPCISGNAFTFLLAEEGEIQCQINQEKVDLEAGEALFINAGQSYRLVRSEKESSSFYIIEVAGEYLAAGDESLQNKYISPVAEAESFAYCRFMPSAEEDTDEDILLQALLAAAQTAEGRDMAYELDMKSWLFTAWGSLYKKFAQPRPECKNAVIRERVKLNRMTGYLTEHCNEKLTLSAMAEACQVSTGDFCRFFKKHMEMTPFEYLQKCRIWNSMDAVLEKIIQRSQSFSEGHCDHDPSDSIGQFDPSGKDGENICHRSKCHDPSAQKDTGKKSIKEQSKGSAWNVPAIEEKKITTYNAKKRNIFI